MDADTQKLVKIQLWDMTSVIQYHIVPSKWWREADGVILLLDVTTRKSFDNLVLWMDRLREYTPSTTKILVVATKSDDKTNRKVFNEEILGSIAEMAEKIEFQFRDLQFMEVSAHKDYNIIPAVEMISKSILKNILEEQSSSMDMNPNSAPDPNINSRKKNKNGKGTSQRRCIIA